MKEGFLLAPRLARSAFHHDGRTQRLYQAQPDKKTTAKTVTGEIAKRNEQNE
jgi:hypothetical protein